MFEQRYSDLAGINTLGPAALAARIVDEEEWMPLARRQVRQPGMISPSMCRTSRVAAACAPNMTAAVSRAGPWRSGLRFGSGSWRHQLARSNSIRGAQWRTAIRYDSGEVWNEATTCSPPVDGRSGRCDGKCRCGKDAAPYPFLSMSWRLENLAAAHPERRAVVDDEGFFTYAELERRSRAIAAFILRQAFAPETPVAVLTGRNRRHLAAALGVWRAGAVYVPLDPALPGPRLRRMLDDCAAPLLIADAVHAGRAERLSFVCPGLRLLLCPELPRFEDAVERAGDLMALELWEHVTRSAPDGSWKSFFTGRPIAWEALAGMARNVRAKAAEVLTPGARVLDVGGGSGAVARVLLENCAAYTAVELSDNELERVRVLGAERGVAVRTHSMEALDIGILEPGFDLIVLNSVVENFPGCNYLRRVLDKAAGLLREGGILLVGMVWDSGRRDALGEALRAHAVATGDSAGLTRFEEGRNALCRAAF